MSEITTLPDEYTTAEGLRTLANYLRNGVKVRSGIQMEKRVDYFKGKKMIETIVEGKKWPKSLPVIKDKAVAMLVSNALLQGQFFHRSEKVDGKKGYLKVVKYQGEFEENAYYTWLFTGNMTWSHIGTSAVIAAVIGFTLLPIWPDIAKRVLWYMSVTFLIGILGFVLVRLMIFLFFWIFGYDIWIFPRLFDETLSMQDSFKPVYSIDRGSSGQGLYRLCLLLALGGFAYWATTQPTEFDEFLKANKDFIDDLYSGNLLADVAHDHKSGIDKLHNVPKLEDLLRDLDDEDSSGSKAGGTFNSGSDDSEKKFQDSFRSDLPDDKESDEDFDQANFDDQMLDELLSRQETEVDLDG